MNQDPVFIPNRDARKLFMSRQGLSRPVREKLDDAGLLSLIKDLGFVQVDSINSLARAHHMILFARNQTYRPRHLKKLLEQDRTLFEHWTHDASIIPTEFYPYWQHRFQRDKEVLLKRWRKARRKGFEDIFENVLAHVAENGTVMTRDFTSPAKKGDGWWDWHPEKTALEFHWRTGNIAISGRDGFQKIYDLASRVIPEPHRTREVDQGAFIDWACSSALDRLGMATSGEIAAFWELVTPAEAAQWVALRRKEGRLVPVSIEPAKGQPAPKASQKIYAPPDNLHQLDSAPPAPKRLRFLSPFDPLIRDRKRCLRLFGFDYRIEIYVPKAKRKFGYYVFPMLEGENLIGRIDVKSENNRIVVLGVWWEPGIRYGKDREAALYAELERYRRFVGASDIDFPKNVVRFLD